MPTESGLDVEKRQEALCPGCGKPTWDGHPGYCGQECEERAQTVPFAPGSSSAGDGCDVVPWPWCLSPYLNDLGKNFGWKLLVLLFASQHLMKGMVMGFTAPAQQYMFSDYNVTGPRMQVFIGIVGLPWAMKPVLGLLSDCLPISGYNKRYYLAIYVVLGCTALLVLARTTKSQLSVEMVAMCMLLVQLMMSGCDLLTEAKYAEKMQTKPDKGPDLMAYVWGGLQAGSLLATAFVGVTMTNFGTRAAYMVAFPFAFYMIVPVLRNYLEEKQQTAEEISEAQKRFCSQQEACFLCILMFVATIALTYIGIVFEDVRVNCAAAVVVALLMLLAFSAVLRPMIAKVNAFFLIQTSVCFQISGATFYFYTDSVEKYAAGPHFSVTFFTSVLGTAGALCSLFGIYVYQQHMREWKYVHLLMVSNLALSAFSMLDIIMFSRLNVQWGIPDHLFIMGTGAFQMIIGQWQWMPGVVILSQLCPKGMEATMYALLAGCHNLGNTVAQSTGAYMLHLLECNPSGAVNEDEQFTNLWKGSLLSTLLPTITLVLLPLLIPDARQTEKLLRDDDRDATKGSLWRRWRGLD